MKRLLFLLLVCLLTVNALASPTVVVTRMSGYYSGNGGEMSVKPSSELSWVLGLYDAKASGADYFQSFCLEQGENLNLGKTYYVELNDRAINGGVGPAGDPISIGTAWLYHEFQNGTLANYDYTPGTARSASAGALQNTIWWLEDEAADPGDTNVFRNMAIAEFGTAAGAKVDNNGAYGVAVLNIYTATGARAQDLLVCVPAPGAILLGGLGIAAVGAVRRKRA